MSFSKFWQRGDTMNEIMSSLNGWMKGRPKWLQQTTNRLLQKGNLDEQDILELTEICKKEAAKELTASDFNFNELTFLTPAESLIRLRSIGAVEGINALSPKKPLIFGNSNLAIIFGQNGSGKSGYVRILKHACGSRNPGELFPNVFLPQPPSQKCCIVYEKSGKEIRYEWLRDSGPVEALLCIDVYDTTTGSQYILKDNETSYEPPLLFLFSELISICEQVSKNLDEEEKKLPSKLPNIPEELASSSPGQWYKNLSIKTKPKEIKDTCVWKNDNNNELLEIQKRLAEQDPIEKAKKLRQQNAVIDNFIKSTQNLLETLNNESCIYVFDLKQKVSEKTELARIAAEKAFKEAPLEGIGSEAWKVLWEKARQYSEEIAYKEQLFPFIGEDARCVLCHQILSDEAKNRFQTLETYVKGQLQQDANIAKKELKSALESIAIVPMTESLETQIVACGIPQENHTLIKSLYMILKQRKEIVIKEETAKELPSLPEYRQIINGLNKLKEDNEGQARKCDDDAKAENRLALKVKLIDLQARQWLSQQIKTIEEEINRLQKLDLLGSARKLVNTRDLSKKKGEIAEKLITDAYVERFNKELKKLGALKIKIELMKTKVDKGKVLHGLRLVGTKKGAPSNILSEGEFRIVSLAAFLSDVESKSATAPFIFDDPISSLDQDFEESVVNRLVALSKDRQVIVFTHRLSLLTLLQDYAKKANINPEVVCIRNEMWGTGEPGDLPLNAQKPEKSLNYLINERLSKARKLLEVEGSPSYEPYAKSICSDFRILLERMIETELLADVVQRFRRAVNTMGKLGKLSKITEQDCVFFDDLMTKYSRFEHSQSIEAPVSVPSPDELFEDLEALRKWREEFAKR